MSRFREPPVPAETGGFREEWNRPIIQWFSLWSLTNTLPDGGVNLATSRKWSRKPLRFNRKSGPQSPRSRDRGAD
jgi:hypothetical protein